jgi:hypothetical protein
LGKKGRRSAKTCDPYGVRVGKSWYNSRGVNSAISGRNPDFRRYIVVFFEESLRFFQNEYRLHIEELLPGGRFF